jgi:tripartite-type tricarboxylate transporter receptor subunit TctC
MWRLCRTLALALLALAVTLPVRAQDYPAKDIHAICNFAAGSGADIYVRYFADKLAQLAGKTVIVDNKPGALGNIATEAAAKSKPDGYTILITPASSTLAMARHVFKTLPFDPMRDFDHVTTLAQLAFALVVDARQPFKTVDDLSAFLKKKGDKASYAGGSNSGIVSAELYKKYAGVPGLMIPYRDPQVSMNDLLGGQIDFIFSDAPFAVEHHKAGRTRILAVTSNHRLPALPDIPTMEEAGVKGFGDITPWWSVEVPAGTPKLVLAKLEAWFNQIVAMDDTKKFLANLGSEPFPGNSQMLKELLARDTDRWGEYVRLANIPPQ